MKWVVMIKNVKKYTDTNENLNFKQIFNTWVFLKPGCFPEFKSYYRI